MCNFIRICQTVSKVAGTFVLSLAIMRVPIFPHHYCHLVLLGLVCLPLEELSNSYLVVVLMCISSVTTNVETHSCAYLHSSLFFGEMFVQVSIFLNSIYFLIHLWTFFMYSGYRFYQIFISLQIFSPSPHLVISFSYWYLSKSRCF